LISFENSILGSNIVFSIYSSFNESPTSNFKIELKDKFGFFSSHDCTIDPDFKDFAF